MVKHNKYCLILAGGEGRRLWPTSRKSLPKQFIDFFGAGRTLLQMTYDRFSRFISKENIFVSTFQDYKQMVQEQLPELPEENILPEPVQLSTFPAAVWGAFHIAQRNPEACVVSTPSDQYIINTDVFEEDVLSALDYVKDHEEFLAMGVRPTTPNTAYGYIQMGAAVSYPGLFRVKSFSEKPELDFANLFVESGEFLWNTGLFLWGPKSMLNNCEKASPLMAHCTQLSNGVLDRKTEMELVQKYYPSSGNRAIDLQLLEECDHVYVKECRFGWADVGCWSELHAVCHKDVDGNSHVGSDKVLFSGTSNTMVSLPKEMGAVIKGLDGYLVAQKDNMLVICPNDDPALIRRLADETQMKLGEEYL